MRSAPDAQLASAASSPPHANSSAPAADTPAVPPFSTATPGRPSGPSGQITATVHPDTEGREAGSERISSSAAATSGTTSRRDRLSAVPSMAGVSDGCCAALSRFWTSGTTAAFVPSAFAAESRGGRGLCSSRARASISQRMAMSSNSLTRSAAAPRLSGCTARSSRLTF